MKPPNHKVFKHTHTHTHTQLFKKMLRHEKMARNHAIDQKMSRISKIVNALVSAKKEKIEISLDKLKATYCIEFGISERKINEYIKHLETSGKVIVYRNDEGDYCIKKK